MTNILTRTVERYASGVCPQRPETFRHVAMRKINADLRQVIIALTTNSLILKTILY
jgi:hypothetical protein